MPKIAFLLLCHKSPAVILEQVQTLVSAGDCVAVHVDQNASAQTINQIKNGVADVPNAVLAPGVRCGWGAWSLVQATLNLISTARKAFPDATHFFLLSGDCMPVKSASHIHARCAQDDVDYIEHADFYTDNWIKTGMTEDRVNYRHWFNERSQRGLFYGSLKLQRALGLKRKVPAGLKLKIGSQWWLLRRSTIDTVMEYVAKNRRVVSFFRTAWIPDEIFFQTLVMHLVARDQVINSSPTFLIFSDYGKPVTFYADHFEMLHGQWQFAARKISSHDQALRALLAKLYASDEPALDKDQSGKRLYDYVRERGRSGGRFSARIWESGAMLGSGFRLNLVLCKKWHIGNRLVHGLSQAGIKGAFGYVFDEENPSLPDLGGYELGRQKRNRHRRAFLRILADHAGTNTLTICIDPSNLDTIRDFAEDGCALHILDLETSFDDAWLAEHAQRIGLGTSVSNGALQEGLLRSLAHNIHDDRSALDRMGLADLHRISDTHPAASRAGVVVDALDVPGHVADAIVSQENFFD